MIPLSKVWVVLWGRPDARCHCDLWGYSLPVKGTIGPKIYDSQPSTQFLSIMALIVYIMLLWNVFRKLYLFISDLNRLSCLFWITAKIHQWYFLNVPICCRLFVTKNNNLLTKITHRRISLHSLYKMYAVCTCSAMPGCIYMAII